MPAMFPSQDIANTLGAWVAGHGLAQFRIAETEKYPHVTFFLNGGVEVPADGRGRATWRRARRCGPTTWSRRCRRRR